MMQPQKGYIEPAGEPADYGPPGPGTEYRPAHGPDRNEERIQCLKYLLFAYNMFLFLCGSVLMGIGIWMAVDRNFITYMVGTDLYAVAIYLILLGGGIIFFVSFLGCCGSVTENGCMLLIYMIVLAVVFLTLLIGGILAGVFRAQIGEAVQETMADTLINNYGVDLHIERNRWITDAWDKAQERLECCAVTTEGWALYQESRWFELQIWNPEDQKPYVPKSCCIKDRFWRLINPTVCQKWRLGPPGSPEDGAINRALYYDGCYDAALNYIWENSALLIGLGISVALILVGGIILTFYLMKTLKDEK